MERRVGADDVGPPLHLEPWVPTRPRDRVESRCGGAIARSIEEAVVAGRVYPTYRLLECAPIAPARPEATAGVLELE